MLLLKKGLEQVTENKFDVPKIFQNVAFMIYSALCNSGTVDSLTNHNPIAF